MNEAYPFVAVVGQQLMKKALILSIINPRLSPVLLRGFRGTAKGTIVRSLPDFVPDIDVVSGCAHNCNPAIPDAFCADCKNKKALGTLEAGLIPMPVLSLAPHLPLFTRRVRSLESWGAEFKMLSGIHRGILVVEKINLFNERTIDSLINFATKGYRSADGMRMSNFILVATMNIEDGEISPALAEKFSLHVNVRDIADIEERIEIAKRSLEYRRSPDRLRSKFNNEQTTLRKRLVKAKEDMPKIESPQKVQDAIAQLCKKFKLGHLEETVAQAALTNAAYEGKRYISLDDVIEVLDITVAHRL